MRVINGLLKMIFKSWAVIKPKLEWMGVRVISLRNQLKL